MILGDDVVYNGNETGLKQLIDQYDKTSGTIIGCQVVRPEQGVCPTGSSMAWKQDHNLLKVKDMVEKPSVERLPAGSLPWAAM